MTETEKAAPPFRLIPSRVYAEINQQNPPPDLETLRAHIPWGDGGRYELRRRVGKGSHSEVFEGRDSETGNRCIVKQLNVFEEEKVLREIAVLQRLQGCRNAVALLDTVIDPASGQHCLVFSFSRGRRYRKLFPELSADEIRRYAFELLQAVQGAHERGVFHRDIKPNNVVFEPVRQRICLIDWGHGDFYCPGVRWATETIGTRYFRAPEVLLGYYCYDYAVDLWCVGCVFARMLFDVTWFLQGEDNPDQLQKTVELFGAQAFRAYLRKLEMPAPPAVKAAGKARKVPWSRFVRAGNEPRIGKGALDLLDRLMCVDHTKRATATEALAHPYFDPVREAD